jgi:hypothetical protein
MGQEKGMEAASFPSLWSCTRLDIGPCCPSECVPASLAHVSRVSPLIRSEASSRFWLRFLQMTMSSVRIRPHRECKGPCTLSEAERCSLHGRSLSFRNYLSHGTSDSRPLRDMAHPSLCSLSKSQSRRRKFSRHHITCVEGGAVRQQLGSIRAAQRNSTFSFNLRPGNILRADDDRSPTSL